MIDGLEDLLKAAVIEVFGTMVGLQIEPDSSGTLLQDETSTVASVVGFIGKVTGVVYIYAPGPFAERLSQRLLGMETSETPDNEMVNDAMGELGNMIVGHLKSRLSDRGNSCVMTIPSIIRGTNFQIEPVSTSVRRVFCFRCHEYQLVLEIMLRPENQA